MLDTPELQLDRITTAINDLAPKVLSAKGSVPIYEAGGLLTTARQLSHYGEEQENFSSYLTNRTPQYKRQTAYDCMSVFDCLKDTPLEQHLARIERTGSVELSKTSQALFEEKIMPDVLKRLEDPDVYLSTGDIRKIIREHKGPRKNEDNNDDDDDNDDDDNEEDLPPENRIITATTLAQFINAIMWGIEGIDEMPLTPETAFELRKEMSGLVDVPYLKKEGIAKVRKFAASQKKLLELIEEDATTD